MGRYIHLPYGLLAYRDYQGIFIHSEKIERVDSKVAIDIQIPALTPVPHLNLSVDCKLIDLKENTSYQPSYSTYTKSFDYDIIRSGLSLRTREAGDFITIDRKGSKQKLKSYFINEKIPFHQRDEIPLLVDGKEIVWIVGYRMNSRYQITSNTKNVVEIKIESK